MRVELNKKALFALASDTRVEILQALQPMRRTVTQLAEALGIDKAAVHRHLKKLVEGGLVKRYDDHGFVYYGLCWKTRDILNPTDNTKIVILLASSIVLVAVAMAAVVVGLSTGLVSSEAGGFPSIFPPAGDGATETTGYGEQRGDEILPGVPAAFAWWVAAVAFPLAAIPLLVMAWRLLRRPKQRAAAVHAGSGSD